MVFKNEVKEENKNLENNNNITLKNEITDFLRNGDSVMLKRVLLKLFVQQPVPIQLKKEQAQAATMLIVSENFPNLIRRNL